MSDKDTSYDKMIPQGFQGGHLFIGVHNALLNTENGGDDEIESHRDRLFPSFLRRT